MDIVYHHRLYDGNHIHKVFAIGRMPGAHFFGRVKHHRVERVCGKLLVAVDRTDVAPEVAVGIEERGAPVEDEGIVAELHQIIHERRSVAFHHGVVVFIERCKVHGLDGSNPTAFHTDVEHDFVEGELVHEHWAGQIGFARLSVMLPYLGAQGLSVHFPVSCDAEERDERA